MRVLHVITSIAAIQGGPSHSTVAAIAAHLGADPDACATLLSTDYRITEDDQARLSTALGPGVAVHLPALYGRHTAAYSPGLVRWLHRHRRDFDVMVLRTAMHPLMTTAAAIARRAGLPYVLTPHGTLSRYVFEHRLGGAKRAYWRAVESRMVAAAAAVQCTTAEEAAQVGALAPQARTVVIPHPFATPPLSDLAPDRDMVLCLARLDPVKGFDVLLPAFRRVVSARPSTRLVLAGSGAPAYEAHLRSQISAAGLATHVAFAGFVSGRAKADLLASASVFVLPSRKENFGLSVVEAMGAGRPVVISPEVNLAPEVVRAGAGLVVPREPVALASALLRLLDAPSDATSMGIKGAAYVRETLSPAAVGAQLATLYRSVLNRA